MSLIAPGSVMPLRITLSTPAVALT
jgi:hypothetical protein